jgi:hypothetical protein
MISLIRRKSPEEKWGDLVDAWMVEQLAEGMSDPVLITHRESTQILFANSKAKHFLGTGLVGRTSESEKELPFKPLSFEGAPVDAGNHPAIRMKSRARDLTRARVTWLTPAGERMLELRIHELQMEGEVHAGDFLLVRISA